RPLSPFMLGTYYRPQLTSVSSIMVRITGIVVLGLAAVLTIWLLLAASAPEAFAGFDRLVQSWFGDLVLLIGVWALTYHLLGRLRHVIWDFGYALDVPTSEKMAIGMFGIATAVTVLTAIIFVAS
ncbi:MAG: succinate dehydrogenase, cytochrome b556 subunit, partial [Shimia sp.]